MKRYSEKDIKRLTNVDWEVSVRKRPQMYFPTAEVNAQEVAKAIEYSARILGVKQIDFIEMDGWSYFCADDDLYLIHIGLIRRRGKGR